MTVPPDPALAALAREAYATGWATTGGPMTDRVRAGCVAAVEMACQHPDDPGILEVTLQLGALEGTWAQVYDRREQLYTQHTDTVADAWQAWTDDLDLATVAREYQRQTAALTNQDEQARRRQAEEIAAALLLALLLGLLGNARGEKFQALIAALSAALMTAEAEGQAGAIAVAAMKQGHDKVDFEQAFRDALAALAGLDRFTQQALRLLQQIVHGAATDLARLLVDAGDTTEQAMVDAMDAARRAGKSARAFVDWAMSKAFQWGGMAAYASMLVYRLNWITAGDRKVCATCEGYEVNSPYSAFNVPDIPHPNCRCTTEPAGLVVALGRFAKYLMGGDGDASTAT